MFKLNVLENDVNKRLDNFIAKCYPNLMKTLIYKFLRTKKIKVNNKKAEPNYKVQLNDEITFYLNQEILCHQKPAFNKEEASLNFLKADDDLQIIYENNDLLIINKPAGVLVHSDSSSEYNSLVDKIKKYLYKKQEYDPQKENTFAPSISNRLDRNTAGLVIASKNYKTLKIINEAIQNKEIKKYYYCFCYGKFVKKEQELRQWLIKDEQRNLAIISNNKTKQAKLALLSYRVIKYFEQDDVSLLEVQLKTGRFHQIRAQLAYLNHPLVGDSKYFSSKLPYEKLNYKHQILIAYKLVFSVDLTTKFFNLKHELVFEIPDEFKNLKQEYPFK